MCGKRVSSFSNENFEIKIIIGNYGFCDTQYTNAESVTHYKQTNKHKIHIKKFPGKSVYESLMIWIGGSVSRIIFFYFCGQIKFSDLCVYVYVRLNWAWEGVRVIYYFAFLAIFPHFFFQFNKLLYCDELEIVMKISEPNG